MRQFDMITLSVSLKMSHSGTVSIKEFKAPCMRHNGDCAHDTVRQWDVANSRCRRTPIKIVIGGGANKLTTNCKCFIKKMRKMAIKENKSQKSFLQRLDAAKTPSCSQLFNKNFNKMSQQAQDFLLMQLNVANRKKKAMRYTTNEKHLALTLMNESPKGYRLLQKIFNLPNKRTLNRLAEKKIFNVGLNDNIFEY
ncbi:unnamed protein product [Parnassius apollo]|uniref:(apollo) hypothetical protein n=1 Tax=Parnassius apollo TaxID=110799 RepID=A0A8S3XNR4_PARAO|nr:unnamed protein product [Parnassius apollo]